jgi:hypothetical protein
MGLIQDFSANQAQNVIERRRYGGRQKLPFPVEHGEITDMKTLIFFLALGCISTSQAQWNQRPPFGENTLYALAAQGYSGSRICMHVNNATNPNGRHVITFGGCEILSSSSLFQMIQQDTWRFVVANYPDGPCISNPVSGSTRAFAVSRDQNTCADLEIKLLYPEQWFYKISVAMPGEKPLCLKAPTLGGSAYWGPCSGDSKWQFLKVKEIPRS